MDYSNSDRAEILAQALPYIKRYRKKIIVVKYGGNAMVNDDLKNKVMEDITLLWLIGIKVVLVHGGGPEINDVMTKIGKQPEFINGLRVTDKETVDIVQMVLAGKVNKSLVNLIGKNGGKAIGISGVDGNLIEATIKDETLGYVGEIQKIDPQPLRDLIEKGYIPVISTIGHDQHGNTYNINGDTAAAWIAGALHAEKLLLMTNTPGVLKDKDDRSTLIPEMTISETEKLVADGTIAGGMIPKVECAKEAIFKGVKNAVIIDGCAPHSILLELLTDEGIGTLIKGDNDTCQ